MTGADALVNEDGEEDIHFSDSDSDLVSLASDLDEDDLAEIEENEKQLKKLPKKKCVALTLTFFTQSCFWYKLSICQERVTVSVPGSVFHRVSFTAVKDDEAEDEPGNELLVDLEGKNEKQDRQTSMWFSKVSVNTK